MKYFLRKDGDTEWQQVSKEDYIDAEQNAGFRPKKGCGPVATTAFGGRGVEGKTEKDEESKD